MTDSVEILYQNVLLADAAYIDWLRLPDESQEDFENRVQEDLINDRRFTQEQAESFIERYKVIETQPNTSSGFSATFFLDNKGTPDDPSDDEEVLAIRGTEPGAADFFEDALIALQPGGEASRQFEDLKAFIQDLKDQGHLQDPITVAGHSLGGHLATMLTLAAEETENPDPALDGISIEHAYTYNGAGLGKFIFSAGLVQLFENLLPGVSFNERHDSITNLFSTAGIELISNVGVTFGETFPIFTENQGEAFGAPPLSG